MNTIHNPRQYQWQDRVIINALKCIRALVDLQNKKVVQNRPSPATSLPPDKLDPETQKNSAALMRINHTGEVCAQALYLGQSITARDPSLCEKLTLAAKEEIDHLSWCEERITQLNSHKSYLNPLWFTGSLFIGTCAGLLGDKWSLGFLAQTEKQVFEHLGNHLEKISPTDTKSRAIIQVMQQEEANHANMAVMHGGVVLPTAVQFGMRLMAKVMTSVAYYV